MLYDAGGANCPIYPGYWAATESLTGPTYGLLLLLRALWTVPCGMVRGTAVLTRLTFPLSFAIFILTLRFTFCFASVIRGRHGHMVLFCAYA